MFNGKNVLVTGGAGFVGANLISRLLQEGCSVRATFHVAYPKIVDPRIEYVQCDLQSPYDCGLACEDMNYVFLCAANTSGAAVMENTPLAHLTPNLLMNSLMLEAAYAANVEKVLFLSSNSIYPLTNFPVQESDANFEFFDKYFIVGWMKRFSEVMCEMYSTKIKKPMQTIIIRPGNIYGPLDDFDWETSHVLPALIRRVVERHDPIEVWGDGSDIKDFIYIDDFVDALVRAMEMINWFEILNIASGKEYCLRNLLHLILQLDGYESARISYDTSKPIMIPKRLINVSRAKRILNFEATTPIDVGLKRTIDWYRSTI
jgi:GDP-L-fucose synthase